MVGCYCFVILFLLIITIIVVVITWGNITFEVVAASLVAAAGSRDSFQKQKRAF